MSIKIIRIDDTRYPSITTNHPYCREVRVFVGKEDDNLVYDENLAIGVTKLLPNSRTILHKHNFREYILVMEGKGVLISENFECLVTQGCLIVIPKNTPHQIINKSHNDLILFWIYTPSGGEKKIINAFYNIGNYY